MLMGLLETLGIRNTTTPKVEAQYAPAVMDTSYGYGYFNTGSSNSLPVVLLYSSKSKDAITPAIKLRHLATVGTCIA